MSDQVADRCPTAAETATEVVHGAIGRERCEQLLTIGALEPTLDHLAEAQPQPDRDRPIDSGPCGLDDSAHQSPIFCAASVAVVRWFVSGERNQCNTSS